MRSLKFTTTKNEVEIKALVFTKQMMLNGVVPAVVSEDGTLYIQPSAIYPYFNRKAYNAKIASDSGFAAMPLQLRSVCEAWFVAEEEGKLTEFFNSPLKQDDATTPAVTEK